jgi:hypothetical protein
LRLGKGKHLALRPANGRAVEQNIPEVETYGNYDLRHEKEYKAAI